MQYATQPSNFFSKAIVMLYQFSKIYFNKIHFFKHRQSLVNYVPLQIDSLHIIKIRAALQEMCCACVDLQFGDKTQR